MQPVVDYQALRKRLGVHLYRQRINIQDFHASQTLGQGRTWFHPENLPAFEHVITFALKCTGSYGLGARNALALQVREHHANLHRLPDAFIGYRVLQITDLHCDLEPKIIDGVIEKLEGLDYDLCVFTGDYRAETWGDSGPALEEMARLLPHVKQPMYGVLGNHDFLDLVQPLEEMGLRILLNENAAVEKEGEIIHVAGIDDPHFYETDDFEQAMAGIPPEATKLLLSHSAEPLHQALSCGIDLMLCGHTHGGQLCLPGGFAVMHNANHPRAMIRGPWTFHALNGYTSAGAGCSMVPVRFFCPPEITIHVLGREGPAAVDVVLEPASLSA